MTICYLDHEKLCHKALCHLILSQLSSDGSISFIIIIQQIGKEVVVEKYSLVNIFFSCLVMCWNWFVVLGNCVLNWHRCGLDNDVLPFQWELMWLYTFLRLSRVSSVFIEHGLTDARSSNKIFRKQQCCTRVLKVANGSQLHYHHIFDIALSFMILCVNDEYGIELISFF